MKKRSFLSIVLCVAMLALPVSASAEEIQLKEFTASPEEEDYYTQLFETELYNFKIVRDLPMAFTQESYDNFISSGNVLMREDPAELSDSIKESLDKMLERQGELEQIKEKEDVVWEIWPGTIPSYEDVTTLEFQYSDYDNADFRPFVTPYILEDQSNVKGNLIIVAGGGYSSRNNRTEGWKIAEIFSELGYNCYVLQRRVYPYSGEDTFIDLSRTIRLVRSKIEELSLGGGDMILAAGFSGGSATILGEIAQFYGDCAYEETDASYVPDEIDAYSADLDVALCIYGPNYTMDKEGEFKGLVTENENIPYMFLAAGYDDSASDDNMILLQSVKDKTVVENHNFAFNGHGFGSGREGTNSTYWIEMADNFVTQCLEDKMEEE